MERNRFKSEISAEQAAENRANLMDALASFGILIGFIAVVIKLLC